MTKWTCTKCGEVTYTIKATTKPKFCSICGHDNVVKLNVIKYQERMMQNKKEVAELSEKLNVLYGEIVPNKKKLDQLIQYFRTQKVAGKITQEEYDELFAMFKYRRDRED